MYAEYVWTMGITLQSSVVVVVVQCIVNLIQTYWQQENLAAPTQHSLYHVCLLVMSWKVRVYWRNHMKQPLLTITVYVYILHHMPILVETDTSQYWVFIIGSVSVVMGWIFVNISQFLVRIRKNVNIIQSPLNSYKCITFFSIKL